MTLAEVYKEATRLGLSPAWCKDTNTIQIDGHRWDRWVALRNSREPKPFVLYRTRSLRGNVAGRIQAGYSVVHA